MDLEPPGIVCILRPLEVQGRLSTGAAEFVSELMETMLPVRLRRDGILFDTSLPDAANHCAPYRFAARAAGRWLRAQREEVEVIPVDAARIRSAWEGRISGCELGKAVERMRQASGESSSDKFIVRNALRLWGG